MAETWEYEELFFDGDAFFASLIEGIRNAKNRILVEFYIFESDKFGERFLNELIGAVKRNVKVHLLVDGLGSMQWRKTYARTCEEAGLTYSIYHELPWRGLSSRSGFPNLKRFFGLLGRVNRRNHRKICTIDGEEAWAGSFNVVEYHLREFFQDKAWRDSGIRVRGAAVEEFENAFVHALRPVRGKYMARLRAWYAREQKYKSSLLRLNVTTRMRRRFYRELLLRIKRSDHRLLATTAYFVPRRSLMRALRHARRKGADVRILLPMRSDVFFLPWLTAAYYDELIRSGIRVFEYEPAMLHAKTVVADDWAIVGSTNLNHRSFMHDLEVDVLVSHKENIERLAGQFFEDCKNAHEVKREELKNRPLWQRILGKFLYMFRKWL